MQQTLIFATNNKHKIEEIEPIIGNQFHLITLAQAGIDIDIPEPYETIEENASEKSKVIHHLTQQNVFSEDTGLCVEALLGEPGVKSARYAGEQKTATDNINLLLKNLENISNRNAHFKTVISLILDKKEYLFTGICDGKIITQPTGKSGFGYDPVFVPDGSTKTFAEMSTTEKNLFSHRKKATDKLLDFLKNYSN